MLTVEQAMHAQLSIKSKNIALARQALTVIKVNQINPFPSVSEAAMA